MVKKKYTPHRGDIVWLNFSPTEGHEQSGRRPALILSSGSYNKLAGLVVAVPITKKSKGFNFEVPIIVGGKNGVVLADHIKSLAFRERGFEFISTAPVDILEEVVGKIKALIEIS